MEDTLLSWWKTTVKEYKESLALVSLDKKYTFEELDEKCDNLAQFLTNQGVRKNDIVAIVTDVCSELVFAILASIKIGAVYMHIDKGYPEKIINEVVECVKPKVILQTSTTAIYKCEEVAKYDTLAILKPISSEPNQEKENKRVNGSNKQDQGPKIAYIALTSGTTGCPKAIRGTEKGLVHSIKHFLQPYPFSTSDNCEACYVAFIWEFLRPLFAGRPMYIIPSDAITCGTKLTRYLAANAITRIFITSSILELILNEPNDDKHTSDGGTNNVCTNSKYNNKHASNPPNNDARNNNELINGGHTYDRSQLKNLQTIILCGEPVSITLLQKALDALPWVRFINLYGISEAADVASLDLGEWYSTSGNVAEYQNCPVGNGIPGVKIAVLDDDMNLCTVGKSGEIFIAGPTIADGYIRLPEQTNYCFIKDPEVLHKLELVSPVYRSGDRGYFHNDGHLEVVGRHKNTEVLIRGQKVDFRVIERCILGIHGVQTCAVSLQDGNLSAIVVCTLQADDIHQHLYGHLPQAFVPSIIRCASKLPISPQTGKVDMKMVELSAKQEFATETEEELAKIWIDVLGHGSFDRSSSFFNIGGHSLLIGKLLSKINSVFDTDFTVEYVFERSKLFEMAEMITKKDLQLSTFNLDNECAEVFESFDRAMSDSTPRRILLTGATGYLGGYILKRILTATNFSVVCLVRVHGSKNTKSRLLETLHEKWSDSDEMKKLYQERVHVLDADLSRLHFGLPKDEYELIKQNIDVVIHCAASVNMLYPYKSLQKDNVEATANILHFCLDSHPKKAVHYISTVSVLDENSKLWSSANIPNSGYTQSKLIAEKLVQHVRDSNNLPVNIYRPGYLSPDTSNVTWNKNDGVYKFLRHCTTARQLPDDLHLDLTPVTFAADFVTRVILNTNWEGRTYNLLNQKWVKVTSDLFSKAGIERVQTETWEKWMNEHPDEFLGSGIQYPVHYDTTETLQALKEWGLHYPLITERVFKEYLKNIIV